MCEVLRDLIMLEPPKIFEVKSGGQDHPEREFVSENLQTMSKLLYII